MVLVNGGFLRCTDIKKFFSESDKKKLARAISKNQVSDPGPSWPSCLKGRRGCWQENLGYQYFLFFLQCLPKHLLKKISNT